MNVERIEVSDLEPGSPFYFDPGFDFEKAVRAVFNHQRECCPIYREFLDRLHRDPDDLTGYPCMPVEAFKHHRIQTGTWSPEKVFLSSGTTGMMRSQHLVRSLKDYQQHTIRLFEVRFGSLDDYLLFALLPNYLEAGDSSLVAMVSGFLQKTGQTVPAFYLYNFVGLQHQLREYSGSGKKLLLIGVTFALLDFAEKFGLELPPDAVIIETGGMKGRGDELMRSDLHTFLAQRFNTKNVFSEYGMTELMSQAFSDFEGRFQPPPSLQVSIREISDPLSEVPPGKSGIVQLMDLANIHTCSFIATGDLGIRYADGSFEIIGRLDQSDIRGCQLLYL
jgi:phenylacetate-coenzyme A ligase PaaK-like adenylate-forming protein